LQGAFGGILLHLHHDSSNRMAIRKARRTIAERYFYSAERKLETIWQSAIREKLTAYRNEGHKLPAIIGQQWNAERKFCAFILALARGTRSQGID